MRQGARIHKLLAEPILCLFGYFMGDFELRRDLCCSLSARRHRDPPPVTVRHNWYAGSLIRPAGGLHSRLADRSAALRNGGYGLLPRENNHNPMIRGP
jgi:hypothetical protein